MVNKILVVDTNNFIEPLEGSFKAVQIEYKDLKELKKLIDSKSVTLLLPELVKLEVERLITEKKTELKSHFSNLQTSVGSDSKKTKSKTSEYIQKLFKEEDELFDKTSKLIHQIFNSGNVINIPLSSEIYLESYKRVLLGKKPYSKEKQKAALGKIVHSIPPDVVLLESVKSYLKESDINYKLIICSRDSDWHEAEDNELSPQIRTDFKDAKLYTTLRECLRAEYAVDLPAVSENVQQELTEDSKQLGQSRPPVPIEVLIEELEKSGSFDSARKNMSNLLNMKKYLEREHLRKIFEGNVFQPL